MNYEYIGEQEEFILKDPELTTGLYFPLANESGVMSSISPDLAGDSKLNQNAFFMSPVSSENLHNDKSSRNIWCKINGKEIWSLTGRSAKQQAELFTDKKDKTELEAGFMTHKITRISERLGIKAKISSVVPSSGELAELMKVEIENCSKEEAEFQIVAAVPIYGRSADNIRDHRHVTSLLHRIKTTDYGVIVNPTMTFDERGHKKNKTVYGVFGGNTWEKPVGFYPTVEEFIGEGGNLENPKALYDEPLDPVKGQIERNGCEALGGLCFAKKKIASKEKVSYFFVLSYGESIEKMEEEAKKFLTEDGFLKCYNETKAYWREKVNVSYDTGSKSFNQWMKWVSFQPMLRRIYGCSFLPHHDYGKGGRGWRDLWQDCLALLIMNPDSVRTMLIDNFAGVRIDGTNATIIGAKQGEFIADRNHITRVWMDHGIWPFLTTNLYIQQTGDIEILLEENTYFKDMQICRGEKKDIKWKHTEGEQLRDTENNVYYGSILEHILAEHLTAFYDVGEHNHIRIRGADWNDALDMASEHGESVAFTSMYASNMEQIAYLLGNLEERGTKNVLLAKELELLLHVAPDTYNHVLKKREVLENYCDACAYKISGVKQAFSICELQKDLLNKANWVKEHIREKEWISSSGGYHWYNGYYDNSKNKVEGETRTGVRMMLTSQVFMVMSNTATDEQVKEIVKAADQYLYREQVGGYRLNTNFHEIKMDLGRMFGFAYGHKENGAVFSHMSTMYASALYKRNASKEAFKAIDSLFRHCSSFEKSKIYPGVPEYIDPNGRGMYHYLTGAASWLLITVVTQMFGVRGEMGDLLLNPQLLEEQFNEEKKAAISLYFAGKKITVIYHNENGLEPDTYKIRTIKLDGKDYEFSHNKPIIKRKDIQCSPNSCIKIEVELL